MSLALVLLLVAAAVAMFALNRPRIDLVAVFVMVALPLTGTVTVPEALAGFDDPNRSAPWEAVLPEVWHRADWRTLVAQKKHKPGEIYRRITAMLHAAGWAGNVKRRADLAAGEATEEGPAVAER